jgi:hypothetical protein
MTKHFLRRLAISTALAATAMSGVAATTARADVIPGGFYPAVVYSNGCSGPPFNTLLNQSPPIPDPTTGFPFFFPVPRFFVVDFRPACDMHDAGYEGGLVIDPIFGVPVNTSSQSRLTVDLKFLGDLRYLCSRSIPWDAPTALVSCHLLADTYFAAVRAAGRGNFDASPFVQGKQLTGTRPNN